MELFQLPTDRYLKLLEGQRALIGPMSYLTVSCRCLAFPPASPLALEAFPQAAVLSPPQLGSADSSGAPAGAHRDTLVQVTFPAAELFAHFLLLLEEARSYHVAGFCCVAVQGGSSAAGRQLGNVHPSQDSAPTHSCI